MSSSNTDLLSNNAKVALSSDNAETEEADVAALVKAYKDIRASVASYDAKFKAVMKNDNARDAFMKAMMDNTELSQSVVADFPNAIEITRDNVKAAGNGPSGVEMYLTPPHGTKGFTNQIYQLGEEWILDVYAYRHANSRDVTVIVVHSGSIPHPSPGAPITWMNKFSLGTTPATLYKSHHPMTYDSDLGDDRYSYLIDYTNNINMIGPDGKNPIVFRAIYKETFTTGIMGATNNPNNLQFVQVNFIPWVVIVFMVTLIT
ncbi:hypothetical protein BDP27DRAFT_694732 [Rhodocollybia butyracea]|uniref:Uncharacterized protein n=1 Tax=Rhodocollybia butyracea TaxID=206335 RepID=A0A9P5P5G4_9AGAR|nr:hypothetical protein BDP27DRAFT_694732 [Rhodocollybia butyracea]